MDEEQGNAAASPPAHAKSASVKPSVAQLRYLETGLQSAGGKLPLFDWQGKEISHKTIRSCIEHGWAQPWFSNPAKPDWLVCRLTAAGRKLVQAPGRD